MLPFLTLHMTTGSEMLLEILHSHTTGGSSIELLLGIGRLV